jgi:hypothetical protein
MVVMHDVEDETPFTEHLLDQFSAYYTITAVAVHLLMQWKAHHDHAKRRAAAASKPG